MEVPLTAAVHTGCRGGSSLPFSPRRTMWRVLSLQSTQDPAGGTLSSSVHAGPTRGSYSSSVHPGPRRGTSLLSKPPRTQLRVLYSVHSGHSGGSSLLLSPPRTMQRVFSLQSMKDPVGGALPSSFHPGASGGSSLLCSPPRTKWSVLCPLQSTQDPADGPLSLQSTQD